MNKKDLTKEILTKIDKWIEEKQKEDLLPKGLIILGLLAEIKECLIDFEQQIRADERSKCEKLINDLGEGVINFSDKHKCLGINIEPLIKIEENARKDQREKDEKEFGKEAFETIPPRLERAFSEGFAEAKSSIIEKIEKSDKWKHIVEEGIGVDYISWYDLQDLLKKIEGKVGVSEENRRLSADEIISKIEQKIEELKEHQKITLDVEDDIIIKVLQKLLDGIEGEKK